MNCKRMEKWILLAGSGELSPEKLERLERHIAGCSDCAAYQRDAARLVEAVAAALPRGEPASGATARLKRAAAAEMREQRGRYAVFFSVRFQWLAAAAALLIAAAVWALLDSPRAGQGTTVVSRPVSVPLVAEDVPLENGLVDIVLIAGSQEIMPRMEKLSDLSSRSDVSLVDRELMILEGLAI